MSKNANVNEPADVISVTRCSPFFPKIATVVFGSKVVFCKKQKIHQTFVRKFVNKNFQKSPHLVTLDVMNNF